MDGSENIFVLSTNQQINSENIEENASCNIYARTFRSNRGLLQRLNVCQRRNMTNNSNQTMTAANDDNNDNTVTATIAMAMIFQTTLKVRQYLRKGLKQCI